MAGLSAVEDNGKILPESARQGGDGSAGTSKSAESNTADKDRQGGGGGKKSGRTWIWFLIGLIVLILVVVLIWWYVRRCHKRLECHNQGPSCPLPPRPHTPPPRSSCDD